MSSGEVVHPPTNELLSKPSAISFPLDLLPSSETAAIEFAVCLIDAAPSRQFDETKHSRLLIQHAWNMNCKMTSSSVTINIT